MCITHAYMALRGKKVAYFGFQQRAFGWKSIKKKSVFEVTNCLCKQEGLLVVYYQLMERQVGSGELKPQPSKSELPN